MINHQNFQHIPDNHVSHSLACRVLGIRTISQRIVCTSKRINQWSYYKPVRSHLRGELTADQRRQMFFDANDGFDIPVFDSPKKAVEALESGDAKWTYNKPRGRVNGEMEWFRIDDFAGYYSSSLQPDWFKGWSGIGTGTYANTYTCNMPNIPVVGFYGMIREFAAWPKMQTSDGRVHPYRVGFLAWIVGDASKKAYFVNFGKVTGIEGHPLLIDTTAANVPLGVDIKIAPVVTSYGFGADEPGITDPSENPVLGGYVATWNECYLSEPSGSNSKYFFVKKDGWWIMPVEPVQLRFAGSGSSTRPDLPDTVKPNIVNGYPRYEKVVVEGVTTGYRVYLQLYNWVDAREEDITIRVTVRVNSTVSPQSRYVFETTLKQQVAAVELPVAATNSDNLYSYYGADSRYVVATHELEMFVPKENYQKNNNTIQVEVKVWAKYLHGEGEKDLRPAPYTPDFI